MLRRTAVACLTSFLFLTSCSRPKPIVVGSKDSPEQMLLGEIIAQHLERRLGVSIQRHLGAGDTRTVHQAMLDGAISLYPEYSGTIVSEILKEKPNVDPAVTFEYARQQMKLKEMVEWLAPLGFNSPTVMVVPAAGNEAVSIGTQAASSPARWKVGVSFDFQARPDGLPSLQLYRLDMGAPLRSMKEDALFQAMEGDDPVNMVLARLSDGNLTLPKWKVLEDNLSAFAPADAAILVRDDVLAAEPNLRGALMQLTGKISLDTMRRLNARVALDERPIPEVAGEFLKSAGLN